MWSLAILLLVLDGIEYGFELFASSLDKVVSPEIGGGAQRTKLFADGDLLFSQYRDGLL